MSPLSQRTTIKIGSIIDGKYRLDRVLAKGGQGVVFAGRHVKLDSPVAVKFLDPSHAADEETHARFAREARAAVRLHTPHVVQVFDYGIEQETPYIVMELLEGEDLATKLAREHRLSLRAASEILTQAARGLQCAHELGLIHRDLKPGNLFMARTAEGEVVKIVDFGVAKATRASMVGLGDHTTEGQLLGSPRYMSPEQARGSTTMDRRSDLWSLAVIVYRAITGERPFEGPTLIDILFTICKGKRRKPSQIVPALSPTVDQFFDRALALEPDDRFQTAIEMATEFAAVVTRGETETTLTSATRPSGMSPIAAGPHEDSIEVRLSIASDIPPAPSLPAARPRGWPVIAAIAAVGLVFAAWVVLRGPSAPIAASDAGLTADLPEPAPILPAPPPAEPAPPSASASASPSASASSSASAIQAPPPAPPALSKPRPAASSASSKKRMSWGF